MITRLRLSAHNLCTATERYRNIERSQRLCLNCELVEVEDEYHFVLICPKYIEIRKKYIKKFYYIRPSMFKFIALINVHNIKKLIIIYITMLGKYLSETNRKRIIN